MGATKKQAVVSSGSRPEHIWGGLGPSTLRTGPRVGCQQVMCPLALELPHPLISIQCSTGDGDAHHHPATGDWLGTVKPSSLLASRIKLGSVSPLMISRATLRSVPVDETPAHLSSLLLTPQSHSLLLWLFAEAPPPPHPGMYSSHRLEQSLCPELFPSVPQDCSHSSPEPPHHFLASGLWTHPTLSTLLPITVCGSGPLQELGRSNGPSVQKNTETVCR